MYGSRSLRLHDGCYNQPCCYVPMRLLCGRKLCHGRSMHYNGLSGLAGLSWSPSPLSMASTGHAASVSPFESSSVSALLSAVVSTNASCGSKPRGVPLGAGMVAIGVARRGVLSSERETSKRFARHVLASRAASTSACVWLGHQAMPTSDGWPLLAATHRVGT